MPARIEDYALLGDCETAALVARDGSIDWLCWPRFDSGACFAALLGGPEHGRWLLEPCDNIIRRTRRYRHNTLVLETDIETADGAATLVDFMPPRGKTSDLVRLVVGKRGKMAMRSELMLRFDYGSQRPWVDAEDDALCIVAGPDMAVLRATPPHKSVDRKIVSEFIVSAGEMASFVLTYSPSYQPLPEPVDPQAALSGTETFWRDWASRCTPAGEWSDAVVRSLITLKALTYRPTGGIVAAPTTSLPEQLGGPRNWDYRFCWLRDATFTLLALMNSGYHEEARAWHKWLLRAAAGDPAKVQIMYGITGSRRLTEWEVPWLPGYGGSKPVHIGNAASGQVQLDIYGEVIDALHQAREGNLAAKEAGWTLQRELLDHLECIWDQPDQGMWEMRGDPQQFTCSKVMAWVAFDRALKSAEQFGLEGPLDLWHSVRRQIHEDVCRNGFSSEIGAFVQAYGSCDLDASVLLIPLVGFLPADDPRVRSTVEAIERRLMPDGFLMRYNTARQKDGLPAGEGAFLACNFWLVDNLLLLGRRSEARTLFERLLSLRNDLGLLSEEYDAGAGRLVGNFPQALSHIALVNTAHNLTRSNETARQRSRAGGAANNPTSSQGQ